MISFKNRTMLSLLLLAALFVAAYPGSALAQTPGVYGPTGQFSLFDWEDGSYSLSLSGNAAVFGSFSNDSQTTISHPPLSLPDGTVIPAVDYYTYQTTAQFQYSTSQGTLRALLSNTTSVNFHTDLPGAHIFYEALGQPLAVSSASLTYADQAILSWTQAGPIPALIQNLTNQGLFYRWQGSGFLEVDDYLGKPRGEAGVQFSVFTKNGPSIPFSDTLNSLGVRAFNPSITYSHPLTPSANGSMTGDFSIGLNLIMKGDGRSDASHTLKLESVLFADGTTPESRGFNLSFATGMMSPNLAAVPEPSSVVMLGLGACGLIGVIVRRRRMA